MNPKTRKRLEAAGWKTSTVQEFLNLDDADMAHIETKLALSRRLREMRSAKRLTQTAAAALHTSQSHVAKRVHLRTNYGGQPSPARLAGQPGGRRLVGEGFEPSKA